MGAANKTGQQSELKQFLSKLTLITDEPHKHIMYFQDHKTKLEYMLRDILVPDKGNINPLLRTLQQHKSALTHAPHILQLVGYSISTSVQFCSSISKVSVLSQHPQRTLDDQTSQRHLQRRLYSDKQLWTILASCILGFAHLQKHEIRHQAVRSSQIFVESSGLIKIGDPYVQGAANNWDCVHSRNPSEHCYLSPELLTEPVSRSTNIDVFKSDVFSMGMVVLECGLLEYQDECYNDFEDLDFERLNRNCHRLRSLYSEEIYKVLMAMLQRNPLERESWMELERYVKVLNDDNDQKTSRVVLDGRKSRLDDQNAQSPHHFASFSEQAVTQLPDFHLLHQSPNETIKQSNRTRKGLVISSINTVQPVFHFTERRQIANPLQKNSQIIKHPNKQSAFATNSKVTHRRGLPIKSLPTKPSQQRPHMNSLRTHSHLLLKTVQQHPEPVATQPPAGQSLSHSPSPPPTSMPKSSIILSSTPNLQRPPQYVVEHFKQGSLYQGYKLNGMRHGRGKFYYQDGGMYDGDWVNNMMTGQGKLYYHSGRLAYEGDWIEDNFNGFGVLYHQNPDKLTKMFDYSDFTKVRNYWVYYEGNFQADLREGTGRLVLTNGEVYQGEFHEDALHGDGMFKRMNGEEVKGVWRANKFVDK